MLQTWCFQSIHRLSAIAGCLGCLADFVLLLWGVSLACCFPGGQGPSVLHVSSGVRHRGWPVFPGRYGENRAVVFPSVGSLSLPRHPAVGPWLSVCWLPGMACLCLLGLLPVTARAPAARVSLAFSWCAVSCPKPIQGRQGPLKGLVKALKGFQKVFSRPSRPFEGLQKAVSRLFENCQTTIERFLKNPFLNRPYLKGLRRPCEAHVRLKGIIRP